MVKKRINDEMWSAGLAAFFIFCVLPETSHKVTFLVEKPAVAVLDVESRRVNRWADLPSADTAALTCKLAQELAGPRGKILLQLLEQCESSQHSKIYFRSCFQTGCQR